MKSEKDLVERMESGEFLVSIQIDPPGIGKFSEFKEMVSILKEAGVALVDINSSRRISHDSIHLGVALSKMGFETIPHVTARDSSINGLANQILAAREWAGLRHFLFITGDPYEANQSLVPSQGVFQTDSVGAIDALNKRLRSDSSSGLSLRIAAAVNQNENDLAKERERLDAKCGAGADFFMSQPVFSESQADHLFNFYCKSTKKPLIVGIWPLFSMRTVEVIKSGRVAGVELPETEYKKMCQIPDDDLAWERTQRAEEIIRYIKKSGMAQGVYIVTPARGPLFPVLIFLKKVLGAYQK